MVAAQPKKPVEQGERHGVRSPACNHLEVAHETVETIHMPSDILALPNSLSAGLGQDGWNACERGGTHRRPRHVAADQKMNAKYLGHFKRRFNDTGVAGAGEDRKWNQRFDQITAMQ